MTCGKKRLIGIDIFNIFLVSSLMIIIVLNTKFVFYIFLSNPPEISNNQRLSL